MFFWFFPALMVGAHLFFTAGFPNDESLYCQSCRLGHIRHLEKSAYDKELGSSV